MENTKNSRFMAFTLASTEYVLPLSFIKATIMAENIIKLPCVLEYLEGIVSINDSIIPIVSLKKIIDLKDVKSNEASSVLVIGDNNRRKVGFAVDSLLGEVNLATENIESMSSDFAQEIGCYIRGWHYMCGIGKVNNRIVMMFDGEKILYSEKMTGIYAEMQNINDEKNKFSV